VILGQLKIDYAHDLDSDAQHFLEGCTSVDRLPQFQARTQEKERPGVCAAHGASLFVCFGNG